MSLNRRSVRAMNNAHYVRAAHDPGSLYRITEAEAKRALDRARRARFRDAAGADLLYNRDYGRAARGAVSPRRAALKADRWKSERRHDASAAYWRSVWHQLVNR